MVTCYFMSFPTIFKSDCHKGDLNLDEILKQDLRLKDNGELLNNYHSIYKYNLNITLRYIKELSRQRMRILLTDQIFMWLPNYFDLHYKCVNILLNEDGYIPKNYRNYIAIMVKILYLLNLM